MQTFRLLVVVLMSMAFTVIPAWGAKKGNRPPSSNNNRKNNNENNQRPQQPPTTSPVDTTQLNEDRKKLAEDRVELTKAQEALNLIVTKLKSAFESSPDRKATTAAARQAQAEYEPLKNKAMETLQSTAEYKAAVEERDQVAATLASDGGAGDEASVSQAASKRLEANTRVTKLETGAVSADPKAAAAHQKLTEAGARMSAQFAEFEQSIKTNPDWTAAKDAVDKAKTQLDADEKKLKADHGK